MLEKTFKKVFTFNSTTDAFAFERACKNNDIPGRLIPVPRAISAGCGICWSVPAEDGEKVEEFMKASELRCSGIYDMLL